MRRKRTESTVISSLKRYHPEMFDFAAIGEYVRVKIHTYHENQGDNRAIELQWNGQRLRDSRDIGRCDNEALVSVTEWLEWMQPQQIN